MADVSDAELEEIAARFAMELDTGSEVMFSTVPAEALVMANPFGDAECVRVKVTRPVNVTQFAMELGYALDGSFQVVLNGVSGEISEESPGYLFITPPVSEHAVQATLEEHAPDADFGLGEAEKRRGELLVKLRAGEDLTPQELHQALLIALGDR